MKRLTSFRSSKYFFAAVIVFSLVAYSFVVYGAQLADGTPPPTGGYAAGDSILDPGCAPGSSNCFQNVGSGWGLAGNAGTDGGVTNFIGTTDAQDFVIKTDGNEVARFYNSGGSRAGSVALGGGTALTSGMFVAGSGAGSGATNAYSASFIGPSAGQGAAGAAGSEFIGSGAGSGATTSSNSVFIGIGAGQDAVNGGNSEFIGSGAGSQTTNAKYSIFIGDGAGDGDTVDNSSGGSSILIGDQTNTDGFSNSIAIGFGATNTMSDQFLVGSTYTNWDIAGVNYAWPTSQAGAAGDVLTNDGSGNLSWTAPGGGGGSSQWTTSGSDIYSNNSGNVGIGTTTPGSKLEVDGSFSSTTTGGALLQTTDNFGGYGLSATSLEYADPSNAQDGAAITVLGSGGEGNVFIAASDASGNSMSSAINSGGLSMTATNGGGDQSSATFSQADGFTLGISQHFNAPRSLFRVQGDESQLNSFFQVNDSGLVGIGYTDPDNLSSELFENTTSSDALQVNGSILSTALINNGAGCGSLASDSTGSIVCGSGGGGGGGGTPGIDGVLSQNQSLTQNRSMDIDGHTFTINDSQDYPDGLFRVNDNGQSYLGDFSGDGYGTYFEVDDNAQAYTFSQPNFNINGVSYVFPNSQAGSAGDVLTNDGSGNLNWGPAGGLIGSTSGIASNSTPGSTTETWLGDAAGGSSGSNKNTVFVGYQAGKAAANSFYSTFIGTNAGANATDANQSEFFGSYSGAGATNATSSDFIGSRAGYNATNASNSEFFGAGAGNSATNAEWSIFIGLEAGYYDTVNDVSPGNSSLNSILLGDFTSTGGFSDSIAIGTHATNTATNQLMIGSTSYPINSIVMNSTGQTGCAIAADGLSCSSDERLKDNITDLPSDSLDTLTKVRTVTFNWIAGSDTDQHIGFLAQDIQQYYPQLVSTASNGYLQVNYADMAPVLVESIRELNLKLTDIQAVASGVDPTFLTNMRSWLASATNGITDMYASVFHGDEIDVKTVCVLDDAGNKTCITKSQLDALLAGQSASVPVVAPSPSSGDSGSGTSTSPDSGTSTSSGSSDGSASGSGTTPDPSSDPAPTPDPTSTPTPAPDPSTVTPPSDPAVAPPAPASDPAPAPDPTTTPDPSSDGSN